MIRPQPRRRHPDEIEIDASGPFSFLNPTARHIPIRTQKSSPNASTRSGPDAAGAVDPANANAAEKDELGADVVHHKWRSRDNRKGRHTLSVTHAAHHSTTHQTPRPTSHPHEIVRGIWRMFSTCPYWDVSYLVAVVFTFGSVVWCLNGFFAWLPLQIPASEFPGEVADGGGWTAFVGATVFEFGSLLLMLEAVNENRTDCFGWAVEDTLGERGILRMRPVGCARHHHGDRRNLVGVGGVGGGEGGAGAWTWAWTWWPSWRELRTHYVRELGFLASAFQLFGATVFWISGFTALPQIQEALSTPSALNGAYWAPQVVGGTGFIVSGLLFMVETQRAWYRPAWSVLGWHIGAWNLVGGIGFTLCGALGFAAASSAGAAYQSTLATFWGSWAFLIGSLVQWFEVLDKHPVDVETHPAPGSARS